MWQVKGLWITILRERKESEKKSKDNGLPKKKKKADFSKARELICRISLEGNLRDKGGQKSWQLQQASVLKAQ